MTFRRRLLSVLAAAVAIPAAVLPGPFIPAAARMGAADRRRLRSGQRHGVGALRQFGASRPGPRVGPSAVCRSRRSGSNAPSARASRDRRDRWRPSGQHALAPQRPGHRRDHPGIGARRPDGHSVTASPNSPLANAKRFKLEHVIWQRTFHPTGGKPRPMDDLGNPDANHYTHRTSPPTAAGTRRAARSTTTEPAAAGAGPR